MALFHANHTLTQGSLHYRLATLGYQKRNTDGVEIYNLQNNSPIPPNQFPMFSRQTTPCSLRKTIGRYSWNLRNEESKGLG